MHRNQSLGHSEVPMASSSPTQEALEHTDPPAFRVQQVDILMALRESIQNPPLGEFRMEDLLWTDHITQGKGRHKGSRMAFIPWDRLADFISGEQNHPLYPCRFNAEVIRRNLPKLLEITPGLQSCTCSKVMFTPLSSSTVTRS